jgi:hypothetical protein
LAIAAFVIAWFAILLLATWVFGSANILLLPLSAAVGVGVYIELLRRDRRA